MLDFIKSLFKAPKLSTTNEKLLYVYIEGGTQKIYDLMPGWLLGGNYEDMEKGQDLLEGYLEVNIKQIKKLSTQPILIPEVGVTMGQIGAYDYLTKVVSRDDYEKLCKNPPSAEDVEKLCKTIKDLIIKKVQEFLKSNELL